MPVHAGSLWPARVAAASFFLLNGIAIGSWVTRIPDVQRRLALSEGSLGLALLGAALGALVAMPVSGWLVGRFGSDRMMFASGAGICLVLPLLPLAPSLPVLFLTLFLFGIVFGALEVPANAQAVLVETAWGAPLMSSFHAMFSVGGLAGAATAGIIAGRGVPPEVHLLAVALVLFAVVLFARPRLLPDAPAAREHGPRFAIPRGPLLGLGVIGFCVLLGEGAIADWSAVYLSDGLAASATVAAWGYAAFSLTMAAGRLAGDWLTARFGPVAVVRAGGALAAAGLGAGLLLGTIPAAIFGFACVGAGLATIFPITMSATGRVPGIAPSAALTAVATAGYTGFLAGPPVIGFASEALGLRAGLGVVALLSAAVIVLAGKVAGASDAAPGGAATEGALLSEA
jgi:MFS family permease